MNGARPAERAAGQASGLPTRTEEALINWSGQEVGVAKDNSWVWSRTIHGCGQVQYILYIQNTLFSCLL